MLSKTPTDLLRSCEALSARTTVVHATHLTPGDIAGLGLACCGVCCCPTTERDLGDGVGPFLELAEAGASLSIGSDSHAVIDPFEECRAIELNERLITERRGLHRMPALLEAGTSGGARALGWPAGGLRVGAMADLVAVRPDSVRIAGGWTGAGGSRGERSEAMLAAVLFGAGAGDVETVVVGGEVVVSDGAHVRLGSPADVGALLSESISGLLADRR